MNKNIRSTTLSLLIFLLSMAVTESRAQAYQPAASNIAARNDFQDMKFGLFIHWGLFSELGDGEWVMNNKNITVKNYEKLEDFFYPTRFDAAQWVSMAKNVGMKYITLITRHHDGFSMWDTKMSDYNIMHTPYKKDIVKLIADECHKQGIRLFLYYSLLDWNREDYPHESGRTGQGTGRTGKGDYTHYLAFMKAQLTELLSNYGEIGGIWFDGYWDQTKPEGEADRNSRINWKYDEIYALIHKLQPQCLIGNNHHLSPLEGEDFQMFEKDLPGQNNSGLSFQKASKQLPLETCETMNNSWGFDIRDTSYKTVKQLIHYFVNAAGRNANFLLNVGPMPNGKIQTEFSDSLAVVGNWIQKYGSSIYNTRAGTNQPAEWGVVTTKKNHLYVHLLKKPAGSTLVIQVQQKVLACISMLNGQKVKFTQNKNNLTITIDALVLDDMDTVIEITTN